MQTASHSNSVPFKQRPVQEGVEFQVFGVDSESFARECVRKWASKSENADVVVEGFRQLTATESAGFIRFVALRDPGEIRLSGSFERLRQAEDFAAFVMRSGKSCWIREVTKCREWGSDRWLKTGERWIVPKVFE